VFAHTSLLTQLVAERHGGDWVDVMLNWRYRSVDYQLVSQKKGERRGSPFFFQHSDTD